MNTFMSETGCAACAYGMSDRRRAADGLTLEQRIVFAYIVGMSAAHVCAIKNAGIMLCEDCAVDARHVLDALKDSRVVDLSALAGDPAKKN